MDTDIQPVTRMWELLYGKQAKGRIKTMQTGGKQGQDGRAARPSGRFPPPLQPLSDGQENAQATPLCPPDGGPVESNLSSLPCKRLSQC